MLTYHQPPKPKTFGEGLGLLHMTIQNLNQKLQKYAQSVNANDYVINERKVIIEHLEEVYEILNKLTHPSAWEWIESRMKDLDKRYPELSGYRINFITKPSGDIMGYIPFNPMQNENF